MTDNHEHTPEGGTPTKGVPPSAFLESTPTNFGIVHLLGMRIVHSQDGIRQVGISVDKRLMHPQQNEFPSVILLFFVFLMLFGAITIR